MTTQDKIDILKEYIDVKTILESISNQGKYIQQINNAKQWLAELESEDKSLDEDEEPSNDPMDMPYCNEY